MYLLLAMFVYFSSSHVPSFSLEQSVKVQKAQESSTSRSNAMLRDNDLQSYRCSTLSIIFTRWDILLELYYIAWLRT